MIFLHLANTVGLISWAGTEDMPVSSLICDWWPQLIKGQLTVVCDRG